MLDMDRVEALNRGEPSTASRTLVPALVAELRATRAALATMTAEMDQLREAYATDLRDMADEFEAWSPVRVEKWRTRADDIERGAHVGAAKGAT